MSTALLLLGLFMAGAVAILLDVLAEFRGAVRAEVPAPPRAEDGARRERPARGRD